MLDFPTEPADLPAEHQTTGEVTTRYEDIAEDGRVKLAAMPHGIGEVCFMKLLRRHPIMRAARTHGILPILSRLVIEGGDGPVSVRRSLEGRGAHQLAHVRGGDGEVSRLLLGLWVDLHGVVGRTHGPPPPNAGERIRVGRVYAEHVFTRPFAPPEERRVRSFAGIEGLPEVPPARRDLADPRSLLALPEGATPLGDALVDDGAIVAFGLMHTDSNQHVNSLEYPRMFEEAVLRRVAALGRTERPLVRFIELAYRKPCFAGDRVRVRLRAFERAGTLGAVCALVKEGDPDASPYCYARLVF